MNLSRFVKQSSLKLLQKQNKTVVFDPNLLPNFSCDMFQVDYWRQLDAILGSATGRGTAWFLKHPKINIVLRHYYRGGLIGKLINDSYFFTGFGNTRAAKEFTLLKTLVEKGLPAPAPVAVQITRNMLVYQADIMIELIPTATDLVGVLSKGRLPGDVWSNIGQTIKRFHQENVYHHDLNAHNIMLDKDNKVWLIDFDQGKIMANSGAWKSQNMQRLLRSFNKELGLLSEFHFCEQNWKMLMAGYNANN